MSASTAVVHLVWGPAGREPFERFLAGYARHDAGADHDLILLYNGFDGPDDVAVHRRLAAGMGVQEVVLTQSSLDLPAYLAVAAQVSHEHVCFLNSYSEPLVAGWLGLLTAPLAEPGAGATAASGSWASHRSFALSLLHLPNGYRGSLGDRRLLNPALRSVSKAPKVGFGARLWRAARGLPGEILAYPGFPAAHLRTNGFAIGRELLLSLRTGALATKDATYRFEAGRGSLTAQVRAHDLATCVVARDGVARAPGEWHESDVFWQGAQEQLLIADNQTRQYEEGSPAVREALARFAWGPRARPG